MMFLAKKGFSWLTRLLVIVSMLAPLISPNTVIADTAKNEICNGIGAASGSCSTGQATQIEKTLSNIVSLLSIIVGIAAIIMVVIAGLKFVTSGGDSSNVSSARSTLMYALIGLVVAAFAQVLVHFVLNKAVHG